MNAADLLFIVLAICAIWLTVFVCIALHHVIDILRDAGRVLKSARHKVDIVDGVLRGIGAKLDHSGKLMGSLAEQVMQFVTSMASKGTKSRKRSSK